MKLKILAVCFLALFIINTCMVFAAEEPALTFTGSNMCYSDGSLMFHIENSGTQIPVDKINITAEHVNSGKTFQVNGTFTFNGLALDYIDTTDRYRYITFNSNELFFYDSGKYIIRMRHYSTQDPYYKEKTFTTEICPGLLFSCDNVDLFIDKCYTKDNIFYAYLHGNGLEKQSSLIGAEVLDLYKGVSYDIQGTEMSWNSISTTLDGLYQPPTGLEINQLGSQQYEITMPVGNNNEIKNFGMIIEKCNFKPGTYDNVRAYKVCTNECQDNTECDDNNICTEDSCTSGNCKYEDVENCCTSVNNCVDSLVCTEDKCVNNRCVNEQIQCTASDDPNIIKECVEPTGCKYSTEKDNTVLRFIKWLFSLF